LQQHAESIHLFDKKFHVYLMKGFQKISKKNHGDFLK